MLERLIRLGDPRFVHPEIDQPNHETEKALRLMAAESRFRRHLLTETLVEMLVAAAEQPNQRRARVFIANEQPGLAYIFLVTPRLQGETDEDYRRHRVAVLHAYCRCAKLRFPQANTFIGIGLDHPARDYEMSSEDIIVFSCDEYTPQAKAEAERFQCELGILSDSMVMHARHVTEFPAVCPTAARWPKQTMPRDDKKRRKAKLARASRQRNRK
jgi:hypothetical protein